LETAFKYKVIVALTSKSKEVIYWPKPMHLLSLRAKGPWVVKLLEGNCFDTKGQCNLDL
jgi:hypothetical protein